MEALGKFDAGSTQALCRLTAVFCTDYMQALCRFHARFCGFYANVTRALRKLFAGSVQAQPKCYAGFMTFCEF